MKKYFALVVALAVSTALGQQPHYLEPVPQPSQAVMGSGASNQASFGLDVKRQDGKLAIKFIAPNGPADKAGLRVGDLITAVDQDLAAVKSLTTFYKALHKHPGDTLKVTFVRSGQQQTANLTAASRLSVYPNESSLPPALNQIVFDNWTVTAVMAQAANTPNGITVWVRVAAEPDSPVMKLDIGKFFVLDGTSQQLVEVTGEQMKYVVQRTVAQNWRSGTYVMPPPSPQKTYRITGTNNGNYTITDTGGGISTVSGSSTGNYTVTQDPDYNQMGAALGLAIRQWRDRKHDKKLLEEAQKQIAYLDQIEFKPEAPLLPGEVRQGEIGYWSGSARPISSPYKVILFFTDPTSGKEQPVTFEFR